MKADKTQIGIGNIQNSLADLDRKIDTIESLYGSKNNLQMMKAQSMFI